MKLRLFSDLLVILVLAVLAVVVGLAWNATLGARAAWADTSTARSANASASIPDIDYRRVEEGVRQQAFIFVDARNPDEFRAGHIPGALSVPAPADSGALRQAIQSLHADARPVVVYCSGVLCEDADVLASHLHAIDPRKSIFIYRGGWEEWQANERK